VAPSRLNDYCWSFVMAPRLVLDGRVVLWTARIFGFRAIEKVSQQHVKSLAIQ
jgi:hypothetical protein